MSTHRYTAQAAEWHDWEVVGRMRTGNGKRLWRCARCGGCINATRKPEPFDAPDAHAAWLYAMGQPRR